MIQPFNVDLVGQSTCGLLVSLIHEACHGMMGQRFRCLAIVGEAFVIHSFTAPASDALICSIGMQDPVPFLAEDPKCHPVSKPVQCMPKTSLDFPTKHCDAHPNFNFYLPTTNMP
eukprot:1485106-Rhodomonas_salina.2